MAVDDFEQFMASVGQQGTAGNQLDAREAAKQDEKGVAGETLTGKILCECDQGEQVCQDNQPNHLPAATEWAEEFADLTSADAALHPDTAEGREAYKRDFWKSLEDDWKEAADADHPWLNEFSSTYEPFKDYQVG